MKTNMLSRLRLAAIASLLGAPPVWAAPDAALSAPMRFAKLTAKPAKVDGADGYQYYVGKRLVPVSGAVTEVAGQWQVGDDDVYLVSVGSGGNGCPATFAFVIVGRQRALASEEFGNCSDTPDVKQLGSRILVSFPRMHRTNPGVVVEYDQGVVYERKKKVPLTLVSLP